MPFVGRQTARGYGCRNGAAAGQLDRLKLLDLVKVFGQTRSKRRKRMRMRIELVSRLGGMDHGADTGIGEQLNENGMLNASDDLYFVLDKETVERNTGKRIDGRAQLGNHALIDIAAVEHFVNLVER